MKFSANRPIVSIAAAALNGEGITVAELRRYFPRYILSPTPIHYGRVKRAGLCLLRWFLTVMVKLFLSPRASSGSLGPEEVDEVYSREAGTYNITHHRTTRGMDLVWRRAAGWLLAAVGRAKGDKLRVLDLCTGTGLTIKEIVGIAREWNLPMDLVGLDYNEGMLAVANRNLPADTEGVRFVRSDATDLVKSFGHDSFDAVTQVFGIGGIEKPGKVFDGVLRVLKPGGSFIMIDMHKPIPEFPGEWAFFTGWLRFPVAETVIYEEGTLPLVLKRLWGWRDTTLCFYQLPLVTYRDEGGKHWGFEVMFLEQQSERWWFALPLMPTARIVVRKVELAEDEAQKRRRILSACVAKA